MRTTTPTCLRRFILALVLSFSASMTGASLWAQQAAQEPPRGPGPGPGGFGGMRQKMDLVKQFDKDGDKRLDASERKAAREFVQKERAEGRGPGGRGFAPGAMLARRFMEADKDGDRKLSKEEFTALAEAWFDTLDSGKSGKVSSEEFSERFGDLVRPPQGPDDAGGGRPPGGGRGFGRFRLPGPGLFAAVDADKDGSLTRPELKGTFEKWFTEWDSDRSGYLAEEEAGKGLDAVLPRGGFGFGGPGGPGRPGGGGPGFQGPGERQEPPRPGPRLTPGEVKSFPSAPLYDLKTLRTFFLEFENADWEKELFDFSNTDVEVPARVMVDGTTYRDVGVHFRGMSSLMGVGEGRKRSLNLSFDLVHEGQNIGGYRTLNLLNSHDDPTFLRAILYLQIAREYIPAAKANFARVVIQGECWGVYLDVQQFNKEFVKDWFGTTKGRRWKVPGSPGGRGSLAYLGEDSAQYKRIYEIKTKDTPEAWADLIRLCKVLNETPAEGLEEALSPLLDVDGALRFLALENVLINNDGYWIRTSDYSLYQDEKGRFHIIPHDVNETFAQPGGPGMGGGPGGGADIAAPLISQGDKDGDRKLTKEELGAMADAWFDKLDPEKGGKLDQEQFTSRFGGLLGLSGRRLAAGGGARVPEPPGGGPAGPARMIAQALFTAADGDKDGSLTRAELKGTFEKWFGEWDASKEGSLDEEKLRNGLTAALPRPPGGGPGGRPDGGPGGPGGPGGGRFRGGFGGGPRVRGVELDPLFGADDPNKPLLSKLLKAPSLRKRYLTQVRNIAEKWLDWTRLGPMAQEHQELIAADVRTDTRKLYPTDGFLRGVDGDAEEQASPGPRRSLSLKRFADERRAFILNHPEVKKAAPGAVRSY